MGNIICRNNDEPGSLEIEDVVYRNIVCRFRKFLGNDNGFVRNIAGPVDPFIIKILARETGIFNADYRGLCIKTDSDEDHRDKEEKLFHGL